MYCTVKAAHCINFRSHFCTFITSMKKYWLSILILIFTTQYVLANHTKGGWMYYEYLGTGAAANSSRYRITLKVYTECVLNSGQADPTAPFTIFSAATFQQVDNIAVSLQDEPNISNCILPSCQPCINNIPSICYKIRSFTTVVELLNTSQGYIISYQRCCRISGIANIQSPSNNFGETWTVSIPGTAVAATAPTNSSAIFAQNDTAIICANNSFTFDFSATDINNDSLVYDFVSAYAGANNTSPQPTASSAPPFPTLSYSGGYSGTSPLGNGVTINRNTGIVSGIAPGIGVYVVTARVSEYRRGTSIKIAEVRKSLHIQVADCNTIKADLNLEYIECDGFTKTFINNATSPLIQSYFWDFGDGQTSTAQSPTHTYADTGVYRLKLVVNRNAPCSDSATSIVRVFPGFFPAFDVLGQCKNTPIQFNDRTTATYGVVNFWSWNFGDAGSPTNTSALQNPTHVYANTNTYNVSLIVASSKGCRDTITQPVLITDKPAINAGRDTLICSIDTLQLNAIGTGSFLWQPNYMISSLTIPNPLVSPNVSTNYVVTLTDPFGCVGSDTIRINVVDLVTQSLNPDTSICLTDPMTLNLQSDALNFTWTETPNNNTITNVNIKNPVIRPLVNTTYRVNSRIGKCTAQNDITVRVVPYPNANAGPNITICPGQNAQLNATGGSIYTWSPAAFLNDRNIANPLSVAPTSSVRYIVTVTDVLGCPKPVRDTVLVNVDRIVANAGPADTSVVLGQPVLLTATGSTNYLWSPPTWLSSINTASTISRPQNNITYRVRVSNDVGCFDEDTIRVNVYFIEPGFNVPNAFTPNGDGKNDKFRPIAIGMQSVEVFRVYNRFGQLLFSSTDVLKSGGGWDGTFRGRGQDPATYVWYAEGTTYQNVKIKRKGTVVLIRE
jgi:gliding motility-associated-like protein